MKAFITSATDSYRLPYARSDSNLLRRTSFAATANSDRLLVDPTGSRRFWTIPVETIDLEALDKLDPVQLWQQVQNDVTTYGRQSFRLTPIEQRLLAERNSHHERPLKAQPEIEDILTDAEDNPSLYKWENMTVSDFKSYYTNLSRYSVEQIGKALDKLNIHAERKSIDGKQVRARKLPRRDWSKQKDRI